ncbi:PLP-dependent aminotransferase family protein [Clostridium tetani]|uniref:MocR-like pyridoxine biosynthesis transcription factor PdxR n=1 Tax=Clostridium tetani TaxID=1513 RepID=UPI00100BA2AA|nr:PLP-dependent aminotransferase family protein [Clostridium tetani]RXI51869.1 PLP-dependent aminotransferase family protein [Clostridium tetani]RXI56323.1 PLP-dependent aminotransferase family protein [Clostridium tetani]RXM70776.1 PLP-dependent aminotransferase family protein [Clostridium tetani]BDR77563.1 GntR family transcriptional regulator [Clostridium tetani]
MFPIFNIKDGQIAYEEIYKYLKEIIKNGMMPSGSKLPSSREMATMTTLSRNTIIRAYELLEEENLVYTKRGKGTFVSDIKISENNDWKIDWYSKINEYGKMSEDLDIMKTEALYKKGMISFKSIAPDEKLFDVEELKRAFLNRVSLEGEKILNYGYAKGYKPLIDYLLEYMKEKGVNIKNKDILITNGFTEGFDIVLSSLLNEGDKIICENPTHNTAIKLMRLHKLDIVAVTIDDKGVDLNQLENKLKNNQVKLSYVIPSYHNPTGRVMSFKRRKKFYEILKKYNVPIVEDGFNEELQHSGTHIAPIAAIAGEENSIIYIGSLSKILFPGMRIGWILADKRLIDILESVKRSRNIHTSFLDQGILYEYMNSGAFEKYVKKVKTIYKEKYEYIMKLCKEEIPNKYILGDGGLYIFIKLKNIKSRELLKACLKRKVIFTPGDMFFIDNEGEDTLRLGFSRNSLEEIEKGIKIIGEEARSILNK